MRAYLARLEGLGFLAHNSRQEYAHAVVCWITLERRKMVNTMFGFPSSDGFIHGSL